MTVVAWLRVDDNSDELINSVLARKHLIDRKQWQENRGYQVELTSTG